MSIEEKANQIIDHARQLARRAKSWTEFSNQMFSQDDGYVAKTFPRMTERQSFYDMVQYAEVNEIFLSLIKRFGVADGAAPKKSGKFIVRVPKTIHSVLEVEASEEGVSLNQLALTKLSVRLKDAADLTTSLIVEAYRQVCDGYSSDRVIVDPEFNKRFLDKCRKVGLTQSDYELNHILFDIRKSGKAVLPPATKKPKITDYDDFLFASEIAFRYLQRRDSVTLDRVLCDSEFRAKFDAIAQRLSPEQSPFKLRMGALYLRKTHRLSPQEALAPSYDLIMAGKVGNVKLGDLPEFPGMYAFYESGVRPIYAGETAHLRHRIRLHLEHANHQFLPSWLELGCESNLELKFFSLPKFSAKDRLLWLNHFINREKPPLNYQIAA
ncbi:MAG TPA: toxin-antitoxin system HicB family antitoxin [Pirellulales bacterium]|nr:toxin-antitoxin system HicB family antitoxin [Pirellulales bacterium]